MIPLFRKSEQYATNTLLNSATISKRYSAILRKNKNHQVVNTCSIHPVRLLQQRGSGALSGAGVDPSRAAVATTVTIALEATSFGRGQSNRLCRESGATIIPPKALSFREQTVWLWGSIHTILSGEVSGEAAFFGVRNEWVAVWHQRKPRGIVRGLASQTCGSNPLLSTALKSRRVSCVALNRWVKHLRVWQGQATASGRGR